MAKNMARLDKDSIVINIEWCSDQTIETDMLVNMNDCPVTIGDIYQDGFFYRNGERLFTAFEELALKYDELHSSYNEGVNSI